MFVSNYEYGTWQFVCDLSLYHMRNWSIEKRTLNNKLQLMSRHWSKYFATWLQYYKWHQIQVEKFWKLK